MTTATRPRDSRQPKPVLCVTPDWAGIETCTFLAGHAGVCSFELPRPKCGHEGCYDEHGHWDGCLVEGTPADVYDDDWLVP